IPSQALRCRVWRSASALRRDRASLEADAVAGLGMAPGGFSPSAVRIRERLPSDIHHPGEQHRDLRTPPHRRERLSTRPFTPPVRPRGNGSAWLLAVSGAYWRAHSVRDPPSWGTTPPPRSGSAEARV